MPVQRARRSETLVSCTVLDRCWTTALEILQGLIWCVCVCMCVCVCCIFGVSMGCALVGIPPPYRVVLCSLNYTVFYLFEISDISQCVLRVPLCDSCRLDLEKHRHLPVRAMCALARAVFYILRDSDISQCVMCAFCERCRSRARCAFLYTHRTDSAGCLSVPVL